MFVTMRQCQKDSPWNGNTDSGKKKNPDAAVNKKSHVDTLLEHERTHYYWFPWKGGKL